MYILTSREQLEKAILRAKKIKPIVRMVSFGTYSVRSSDGQTFYTVRLSRNSLGQKIVECDCRAGQKNLVCFHSCSALEMHGTIAKRRQVEVAK
jgi:hypothetical protein